MIYVDSSVLLAAVLSEDRRPPETFWNERLGSSRLLQYEAWNRLHARSAGGAYSGRLEALLDRVDVVELSPDSLERALQPFPPGVRTLDGLHLATVHFLRSREPQLDIASYDRRLLSAARALDFRAYEP